MLSMWRNAIPRSTASAVSVNGSNSRPLLSYTNLAVLQGQLCPHSAHAVLSRVCECSRMMWLMMAMKLLLDMFAPCFGIFGYINRRVCPPERWADPGRASGERKPSRERQRPVSKYAIGICGPAKKVLRNKKRRALPSWFGSYVE